MTKRESEGKRGLRLGGKGVKGKSESRDKGMRGNIRLGMRKYEERRVKEMRE